MNNNENYNRLSEMEKKMNADRKKREYKTIAAFTLAFFLCFCFFEGTPEKSEIFTYIVAALFAAVLNFGINHAVFEWLFRKEEADRKMLEFMRESPSDTHNEEPNRKDVQL